MEAVFPYLVDGFVLGAIYALVALGYTMVYGILGMINFAHGEIFMLGGFHAILFLAVFQGALPGIPPWAALAAASALAMAYCGGYGWVLERLAYRPLAGAPPLSLLITAVGMSFLLQNAVMLAQGAGVRPFPSSAAAFLARPIWPEGGFQASWLDVSIVLAALGLMGVLQVLVQHTRLGVAMRATAQDRRMASLVGVDPNRVIAVTFVIGSALAAAAGVMVSMYVHTVKFNDGYIIGMKAFTAAVLGGIGNIPGAMAGGVLLGLVENVGVWLFGGDYKDVYSFAVLMAVLVLRPRGLLGERVADKV